MAWYIARHPTTNKIRSIEEVNGDLSDVYTAFNESWLVYRIQPVGDGTFTLIPQQIASGTAVTDSVLTGGTLEDVP